MVFRFPKKIIFRLFLMLMNKTENSAYFWFHLSHSRTFFITQEIFTHGLLMKLDPSQQNLIVNILNLK